jgi:hypothetical protein
MRFSSQISMLAIAIALLPACSKPATPGVEKPVARTSEEPFQRNGELLSVNIDGMPRQAFIAKMAELTGVKITAEGDNNQTVSVHAVDASLRKVLSMAIADAPYSVTMQYTNLQDSFPASVVVSRYRSGAQPVAIQPGAVSGPIVQQRPEPPAMIAPVQEEPERPDITAMPADEQISYFLKQSNEDQVSIIFDMEPTAQESALMTRLMQKDEVSSEVKIEMLDSLSNGEYENSAPAIKIALGSAAPEVATKAAEVLAELGSSKDIPELKQLAEKTSDEGVRSAVNEAIDTLQE